MALQKTVMFSFFPLIDIAKFYAFSGLFMENYLVINTTIDIIGLMSDGRHCEKKIYFGFLAQKAI